MSSTQTNETRLDKTKRELVRNMIAASSSVAICVSLMNPLDVLRIRWQTRPSTDLSSNLVEFTRHTIRDGGGVFSALYRPGLAVNAASVACSSGFRLGLYPVTKETLSKLANESDETHPRTMFLAGFLSGAFGFFLATPLFTAKIQAQSYDATKTGGRYLIETFQSGKPFAGWYVLVARGALFSAGANAGYDLAKTWSRQTGRKEGPLVHAGASVLAALVATSMAGPFDAILTRFQSQRVSSSLSVLGVIRQMHQEKGVLSFYKGWTLFFARVGPLFLIQMPLYEQIRKLLGMDFMR